MGQNWIGAPYLLVGTLAAIPEILAGAAGSTSRGASSLGLVVGKLIGVFGSSALLGA
jgi:hypothetical protein